MAAEQATDPEQCSAPKRARIDDGDSDSDEDVVHDMKMKELAHQNGTNRGSNNNININNNNNNNSNNNNNNIDNNNVECECNNPNNNTIIIGSGNDLCSNGQLGYLTCAIFNMAGMNDNPVVLFNKSGISIVISSNGHFNSTQTSNNAIYGIGFYDNVLCINNQFEFYCDALSSLASNTSSATPPTTARTINFNATGVVLREFKNLGCDLCTALTARATVTIKVIDKENKLEYESVRNLHTQTLHPTLYVTVSGIDTAFNFVSIRAGTRSFNVSNNVLDVILNEYELEYKINNVFEYYFNENFCDDDIGTLLCIGWDHYTTTKKTNKKKCRSKSMMFSTTYN